MKKYFPLTLFILLAIVYFIFAFDQIGSYEIFLTVASFLFAIFTGFFISRQEKRYTTIRDLIAQYDGAMTSIFRESRHISKRFTHQIHDIIEAHYQTMLNKKTWDWHFTHKSETVSSIHRVIHDEIGKKRLSNLQFLSLQQILNELTIVQTVRKHMIAMKQERIPIFQWLLIYVLAILMLCTLSILPLSEVPILDAIFKGIFATAVIFVMLLLRDLDNLNLYEEIVGEASASDVLEIMEGTK